MQKIKYWSLAIVITLSLTACKTGDKKDAKQANQHAINLENAVHTLQWTAFKTTAKTPVKGTFNTINITENGKGETLKEAFDEVVFEIPVSSIFSNDSIRDGKLQKFFFDVMDNTALLSGKIHFDSETKGYLDLQMNNTNHKLPFIYNIEDQRFSLKTTMALKDWNALDALNTLHEACYDLHTGEDGVSKTWDVVDISLFSTLE